MPKSRGFPLIELLVVITIVSILIVIGMTMFSGVRKGANDTKRRNDIIAIAKVMEANRNPTGYQGLSASFFTDNVIPQDPINVSSAGSGVFVCNGASDQTCRYCMFQGLTLPTPANGGACSPSTQVVSTNLPSGGAANPYWMVCTNLEAGGVFCKRNQQ